VSGALPAGADRGARRGVGARRWLRPAAVTLGVLLAAVLPLASPADTYRQSVAILTLLLVVTASGWNIISGFAGYVSLGQSAFLGVGAYTVGIISLHTHVSPFALVPLGGIAAVVVSAVLGLVAMRTRGHAFVIITIALLFLMQTLALNLASITGGSAGLTLPLPTWSRDIGELPFYYAMLILAVLAVALGAWVRRSKLGAGLLAIREDEGKAAAIGIRTPAYKLLGFMASAVLIGVAGGVYGYFLTFVDPRGMFDILLSVQIVLAAMLGGRGTVWGPALGAVVIQPLSEVVNVHFGTQQGLQLLVFGVLLGAVVVVLPKGIIPTVREVVRGWRERGKAALFIEQPRGAAAAPAGAASGPAPGAAEAGSAAQPVGEAAGTQARQLAAVVAERLDPPSQPAAGAEEQASLLELDGLSKRFGGLTALDGCSFAVREGSITGLIGPNGSGKTTVFNLVSGMVPGERGEVRFQGRRIDQLPSWDRSALGIGRTFQITRLFRQLTVLENVVAPLRRFSWRQLAAGGSSGAEAARAQELLDLVGLGAFTGQQAGALSFGQQKLVELAQVLMLEPRLLLLDEPAGGVNPALIERIAEVIRELNRSGITFLVVEHNMPLVLELCDPVVVLAAGRPIAQGPPRAIQRDPRVLGAYLGGDGQQTERLPEGPGEPQGPEGSGEPRGPEGSGEPRGPEGSGERRGPEGSGERRGPEGSGEPRGSAPVDHPPVDHPPVGREV
jgi:ABC-type branched-subunit amino acid transport system ATPase component/ABC-type branched-subunit amino acid transport system permease subunit